MNEIIHEIKNVKINVPADHNEVLKKALDKVNSNDELKTLWYAINVNALKRLKMTDHGHVHFQIVANIALKLTRILKKHNVKLSVEEYYNMDRNYGELVVFLGSLFHDLGMTINRKGHEEFSLIISNRLLREILDFLPEIERTIVISETLHAIISHRSGGTPYTLEAGILRVADALDMTEGRSRITYEEGQMDIHTISHTGIEKVDVLEGDEKPINIKITMSNSAGLFQVDELLKKKLKGSKLEQYVSVGAYIENENEKNLMREFVME